MKLRRKRSPVLSNSPRLRQAAGDEQAAPRFAYRARRSATDLNVGREARRETLRAAPLKLRHFMLRRFGLVLLMIALVLSVANIITLSPNARILPLTSATNVSLLQPKSVYQQAADQLLAASFWNRSKLTINTAQINQGMLARFPELDDVSVTLPLLGQRPIVYLQIARPALVLVTRGGSFVVSDHGKALLPTSGVPSLASLQLPVVTDQSGLVVQTNHQALSSDTMAFIRVLSSQLTAKHLTISTMVLPTASSELDVRLVGQPYVVKFNLESGGARQQVGTFLATQAKLQSQTVSPTQYIDVRVEGRAYYQ